jgi:hypothetical protein
VDTSTTDRNDIWRLGGSATPIEQVGVIERDKHASDKDTENVENDNTPEHAADSL